jgi:hypothetical protein
MKRDDGDSYWGSASYAESSYSATGRPPECRGLAVHRGRGGAIFSKKTHAARTDFFGNCVAGAEPP